MAVQKDPRDMASWEDDRNDYVDFVDRLMARDGGSPTLSFVRRVHPFLINPEYAVSDGGWAAPGGFASN